ncbi:hypothetical protein ETD83_39885 [Actinomadura soli]|uniref:Uncharacterized protein n=1 Tax=Actinomadura soli TaxID=2508997 RepID=A0A5C4IYS7_9ACTN|nr:hypothetical protein [Actinomadura soli]TMQ87391.1 hypothetical protein ETD83_39885 [Actinomadura soli]
MTITRRIGAVTLAAPLAMGVPVLAAVPAQAASTGVTAPANGSVVTSGSQLTARARFDFALTMQLWVRGPGIGDRFLQERFLAGNLSGTFPISRNGSYTVYLKGKQTGHVYDDSTFQVRIAPAAPTGVSARVSGSKLVVKWNRGHEDDLNGYTLSGSGVESTSGSVGSLCQGTSCSASLSMTRSSGPVSVGVRARRPTGSGGSLYSGTVTASAMVAGSAALPGGVGAPSLPSGGGVPGAGTPLTPFNNESPVTLPSVQPDGATPGFAYPAPQIAADSPTTQNVAATERLQWGKSVGIALVLLIAAAHLGTWTRRLRVAQAGMSSSGMAARIARSGTGRKRVSQARRQIARAEARAKTAPVMSLVEEKAEEKAEEERDKNVSTPGEAKASDTSLNNVSDPPLNEAGDLPSGKASDPAAGKASYPASNNVSDPASGKTGDLSSVLASDPTSRMASDPASGMASDLPSDMASDSALDKVSDPSLDKAKAARRPAALGKRSGGGVHVRIARSSSITKPKRGRRRK